MFLRIGAVSVNMDQVLDIHEYRAEDHRPQREPEGHIFRLSFGHPDNDSTEHMATLSGADAEAFSAWLDEQATNLTPATEDDQEWEEYKARVGEMDRARWEATKRELHQLNRDMNDAEPSARQMNRASELEVRLGY